MESKTSSQEETADLHRKLREILSTFRHCLFLPAAASNVQPLELISTYKSEAARTLDYIHRCLQAVPPFLALCKTIDPEAVAAAAAAVAAAVNPPNFTNPHEMVCSDPLVLGKLQAALLSDLRSSAPLPPAARAGLRSIACVLAHVAEIVNNSTELAYNVYAMAQTLLTATAALAQTDDEVGEIRAKLATLTDETVPDGFIFDIGTTVPALKQPRGKFSISDATSLRGDVGLLDGLEISDRSAAPYYDHETGTLNISKHIRLSSFTTHQKWETNHDQPENWSTMTPEQRIEWAEAAASAPTSQPQYHAQKYLDERRVLVRLIPLARVNGQPDCAQVTRRLAWLHGARASLPLLDVGGVYADNEETELVGLLLVYNSGDMYSTCKSSTNMTANYASARAVLLGMSALHRRGIAHRAINGNNVFISPCGLIYLGDCALADSETSTSAESDSLDMDDSVLALVPEEENKTPIQKDMEQFVEFVSQTEFVDEEGAQQLDGLTADQILNSNQLRRGQGVMSQSFLPYIYVPPIPISRSYTDVMFYTTRPTPAHLITASPVTSVHPLVEPVSCVKDVIATSSLTTIGTTTWPNTSFPSWLNYQIMRHRRVPASDLVSFKVDDDSTFKQITYLRTEAMTSVRNRRQANELHPSEFIAFMPLPSRHAAANVCRVPLGARGSCVPTSVVLRDTIGGDTDGVVYFAQVRVTALDVHVAGSTEFPLNDDPVTTLANVYRSDKSKFLYPAVLIQHSKECNYIVPRSPAQCCVEFVFEVTMKPTEPACNWANADQIMSVPTSETPENTEVVAPELLNGILATYNTATHEVTPVETVVPLDEQAAIAQSISTILAGTQEPGHLVDPVAPLQPEPKPTTSKSKPATPKDATSKPTTPKPTTTATKPLPAKAASPKTATAPAATPKVAKPARTIPPPKSATTTSKGREAASPPATSALTASTPGLDPAFEQLRERVETLQRNLDAQTKAAQTAAKQAEAAKKEASAAQKEVTSAHKEAERLANDLAAANKALKAARAAASEAATELQEMKTALPSETSQSAVQAGVPRLPALFEQHELLDADEFVVEPMFEPGKLSKFIEDTIGKTGDELATAMQPIYKTYQTALVSLLKLFICLLDSETTSPAGLRMAEMQRLASQAVCVVSLVDGVSNLPHFIGTATKRLHPFGNPLVIPPVMHSIDELNDAIKVIESGDLNNPAFCASLGRTPPPTCHLIPLSIVSVCANLMSLVQRAGTRAELDIWDSRFNSEASRYENHLTAYTALTDINSNLSTEIGLSKQQMANVAAKLDHHHAECKRLQQQLAAVDREIGRIPEQGQLLINMVLRQTGDSTMQTVPKLAGSIMQAFASAGVAMDPSVLRCTSRALTLSSFIIPEMHMGTQTLSHEVVWSRTMVHALFDGMHVTLVRLMRGSRTKEVCAHGSIDAVRESLVNSLANSVSANLGLEAAHQHWFVPLLDSFSTQGSSVGSGACRLPEAWLVYARLPAPRVSEFVTPLAARALVHQLLRSIAWLHDQGMTHGAISLDVMMVSSTPPFNVWLLDGAHVLRPTHATVVDDREAVCRTIGGIASLCRLPAEEASAFHELAVQTGSIILNGGSVRDALDYFEAHVNL